MNNTSREQRFITSMLKFKKTNDDLAKKYGVKISIGMPGMKDVVISDHLNDKNNNNGN